MIKYVIVEDEFPAREELKYFLGKYEELQLQKEFDNPLDALKYLNDNKTDVVFLDINMPGLDGVSLGKILTKINKDMKIIFTTAYKQYAVDAFEIKAFDYVLKPFSDKRMDEVLTHLINETYQEKESTNFYKDSPCVNKITGHLHDKIFVISVDDIYYIETSNKENLIYTKNETYVSKLKISKLEELLPKDKFYRTHRSFIVNLDRIVEVEPWFNGTYLLKLMDLEFKVPISRNNVKEFKEILIIK